jgi:hypothetical protein
VTGNREPRRDHHQAGYITTLDDVARLRRQLRRRTRLPLMLGWGALVAGVAFRDLWILAVVPLLGIGTVNYITGWPIRRR